MKRLAGKVTAIFLAVVMVFTFMPLTGKSFAVHADDVGMLGVYVDDDGMLTWDAVEDANHYTYYVEDKEIDSEQEPPEYGINLNLTVEDLISEGELPEAESYAVKVEAYDSDDVLLAEGSAEFSYTPEDPGDPEVEKMNASIDSSGILSWEEVDNAYGYEVEIAGWTIKVDEYTTEYDLSRRIEALIKSGEIERSESGYEISLRAENEDEETIAEWGPETFVYESSAVSLNVGEIKGVSVDEEAGALSWDAYDDGENKTVGYRIFVVHTEEDGEYISYNELIEETQDTFRWKLQSRYEDEAIADGDTVTIGVEAYTYVDPENIPEDLEEIDVDDIIKIGEWSQNIVFHPFKAGELEASIDAEGMLSHTAFDGEDNMTYTINDSDEQAVMYSNEAIDLKYQIDRMIRDHIIKKADNGNYAVTLYSYDEEGHCLAQWSGAYAYASEAEPVEVAEITPIVEDGVLSWEAVEGAENYFVEADSAADPNEGISIEVEEASIELEQIFRELYDQDFELEDGDEVSITIKAYDETGVTLAKGTCSTEYVTPENTGEDEEYPISLDYDEESDTLSWDDYEGASYYSFSYIYDDNFSESIELDPGVTQVNVKEMVEACEKLDGSPGLDDESWLTLCVNAYDENDNGLDGGRYESYRYEKVYPDIEVNFDEESGLLSWQKEDGVGRYELDFAGYEETFTDEFDINGNIYSINVYDFIDREAQSGASIWADEDDGLVHFVLRAYGDGPNTPRVAQHKFAVSHEIPEEVEILDMTGSISDDGILSWEKVDDTASYELQIDEVTVEFGEDDPVVDSCQIDLKAEIDKLIESGELENDGEYIIRLYGRNSNNVNIVFYTCGLFEYVSDKAPLIGDIEGITIKGGIMSWTPPADVSSYTLHIENFEDDIEYEIKDLTEASFNIDEYLQNKGYGDGDSSEWDIEVCAYNSKDQKLAYSWEHYIYPEPSNIVSRVSVSDINTDLYADEEIEYTGELIEPDEETCETWTEYWMDTETGQMCKAGVDGGGIQTAPIAGHTYKYVISIDLNAASVFGDDVTLEYNGETFTKDDGLVIEYEDEQKNRAEFSGFVDDVTVPGGEEPEKPDLADAEVTMLYNSQSGYMPLTDRIHMYNGSSYELEGVECKVVVDGAELVEGKDYTVSFKNNEGSRDDMKVIFTGKGDYEGTEKVVDGIKIRKAKVTIKDQVLDPLHMDPQDMEETVVLEAGEGIPEKTLTRGTDYIVDGAMYELVPGETTAVIMAYNRGDYVGYFNVPCTFLPTPMSSVSIKLPEAAYTFTGKAITPAPVVTFKSSNGKTMTLENGTDYTVSYADNVNAGTATVKVTGKGRFSGEKNVEFTIKPSVESAQVKVRGEDPTQNVYLFDPNEWDSSCYYQLIPDEVDVEYGDKTLKEGQDYSFMFTYEEAPEKLRMTLRGEGEYAGEKIIDIPMAEVEAKIDDAVLTDIFDAPELSGTVKIIGGTDKGKVLTEGTDYKLTYGGDRLPGEGKYVEIEGIGRYSGYMSAKCKLLPSPMASQNVTVTLPASAYTYSGKAIMPTPVVKFKSGKAGMVTLKNGTDYTVSYAGNVNAGTATVKVTGKGRFSGVKSATFKISKAANTLSVKAKTATVKAKKLKKKNQTLAVAKVLTVSKKIGKVTYVKKGGNKKISINATTGKVTVKKKLKKGTYKVKVAVTASGDANHNAKTKQVTFKVKVK